jgi:DnaJ-domain-containing protein 1
MSLFLDIDRTRSVFRLLFFCSYDSAGADADELRFDDALFQVTHGVQIPRSALGKLGELYQEVTAAPQSVNALALEVARDFEKDEELRSSVLLIVLRISNDEGMLCAKDRERVRIVTRLFALSPLAYETFSDFERGMLASCLRDISHDIPMEELSGHFTTLGCTPEMTAEEIRQRYRRLVMELHPDRSNVRGDEGDQSGEFQQVQLAYQAIRRALS